MVAEMQRKSLRQPDETETFPLGFSHEVHLGELTVARNVHEPGWHWAEHVRPIVGGASCRFHHTGVVIRGRARFRHQDGSEFELGPDDAFDIPPGHDAWVVGDEPYETIDWVGSHRWASPPAGQRVLATILFTDIVDSTATAAAIGHDAWARVIERHLAVTRRVLDRYGGREIATTGDGVLAIFDGAERAVRGAASLGRAVRETGIEIRAGVHTGEIELVPGNVLGLPVHVAARIMALAGPGEVLVSGTTRGLIETDDLAFVDRGRHRLKGVAEPRSVFALA